MDELLAEVIDAHGGIACCTAGHETGDRAGVLRERATTSAQAMGCGQARGTAVPRPV